MITDDPDYERLCNLAHDWRERIEDGNVSDADLAAFEKWLDEDIRHIQVWERSRTLIAAYSHLKPDDLDLDLRDLHRPSYRQPILQSVFARLQTRTAMSAAIACLILIIAVPAMVAVFEPRSVNEIAAETNVAQFSTGLAEIKTITLEDETEVTLGANTALSVSFSKDARSVVLKSGAAMFAVASYSDRPFSVMSGDLTATVLGTEFEVRSNGGVHRVAVAEGRVEVSYPYGIGGVRSPFDARRELGAGQQVAATQAEGLRPTSPVSIANVGAWRDRKLIYDGATIKELVADANRYFERQIVLDASAGDLGQATITASFDVTDRDGMLETLAYVFGVEIDDSPEDRTVLKSAGNPAE